MYSFPSSSSSSQRINGHPHYFDASDTPMAQRVNGICEPASEARRFCVVHDRELVPSQRVDCSTKRRLFAGAKNLPACNIVGDMCTELPSRGFDMPTPGSPSPTSPSPSSPSPAPRKQSQGSSKQQTPSRRPLSAGVGTHDRRKKWQGSKELEISLSLSSSFGRGTFTKPVGSSLECLLDAVETELPSERKEKEVKRLPRSPSLCALYSLADPEPERVETPPPLDYEDPTSSGSGCGSPSSTTVTDREGGEEWKGVKVDSQLSLPTMLDSSLRRSCGNLPSEEGEDPLNLSGRGLSIDGGVDFLSASGRGLRTAPALFAGRGKVRKCVDEEMKSGGGGDGVVADSEGSSISVASTRKKAGGYSGVIKF